MKNIIFLTLVMILMMSCTSQRQMAVSRDFDVREATQQTFYMGAPGAGYRTDFKVQLLVNTNEQVRFDSVWHENRAYSPTVINISRPGATDFRRGEIIELQFNYRYTEVQGMEPEQPVRRATAPAYEGAALIQYRIQEQRRGFVIPEITQLEPVMYP